MYIHILYTKLCKKQFNTDITPSYKENQLMQSSLFYNVNEKNILMLVRPNTPDVANNKI